MNNNKSQDKYLTQSEIYNQVNTLSTSNNQTGESILSKNIATLIWLKTRKYNNKFIKAALGMDNDSFKNFKRSCEAAKNKPIVDYYIHQLTIFTPQELFSWALRNNINPSFQPPYITRGTKTYELYNMACREIQYIELIEQLKIASKMQSSNKIGQSMSILNKTAANPCYIFSDQYRSDKTFQKQFKTAQSDVWQLITGRLDGSTSASHEKVLNTAMDNAWDRYPTENLKASLSETKTAEEIEEARQKEREKQEKYEYIFGLVYLHETGTNQEKAQDMMNISVSKYYKDLRDNDDLARQIKQSFLMSEYLRDLIKRATYGGINLEGLRYIDNNIERAFKIRQNELTANLIRATSEAYIKITDDISIGLVVIDNKRVYTDASYVNELINMKNDLDRQINQNRQIDLNRKTYEGMIRQRLEELNKISERRKLYKKD